MAKKKDDNVIDINNLEDVNKLINRIVKEISQNDPNHITNITAKAGEQGFKIRIDGNSISLIENSKNTQSQDKAPAQQKESLIDIIDKEDSIVIIAEMRGIEKKDIKITTDGSRLNINATGKGRFYSKSITLPSLANPKGSDASYNNGVLEVTLRKGYYSGSEAIIEIE